MTKLFLVHSGNNYYPKIDDDWVMVTADMEEALGKAHEILEQRRNGYRYEDGWVMVHALSTAGWEQIMYSTVQVSVDEAHRRCLRRDAEAGQ